METCSKQAARGIRKPRKMEERRMKILVSSASPLEFETPCLVLPLCSDTELSPTLAELDSSLGGLVSEILQVDGFKAAVGETRLLYTSGQPAARVLLLGMGKGASLTLAKIRQAAAKGARAVRGLQKTDFAFALPTQEGFQVSELAETVTEGVLLGLNSFDDFKSDPKPLLDSLTILSPDTEAAQKGITRAEIACGANAMCRKLVNLPSNLKSPAYFGEVAQQIAAEKGLKCEVWDEKKLLEEKMGALYGVGMGSANKPRFIILEHAPPGTENDAPIALVGKGMSFDSGGYSIKPAASMEDMKDDMAGAGVVLSVMSVLSDLKINKRVLGVVASAENMVSSNAQRPGDIVTARNGKTIEVLNTDAEGRLILADALSWTSEQNPAAIVDLATLTGAIGIALGQEGGGLFSNDDALSQELLDAGIRVNEKLWPFPMWEDYDDYMKGTVSDLKNIGPERRAGSIAAAVFLRAFVGEGIPWAHLDIAAVSLVRSEKHLTERGATGFGVRLLLDYLS